jgi:hypothetical protein
MPSKNSIRRALNTHRGSPDLVRRRKGLTATVLGLVTATAVILTTITGMAYATGAQPVVDLGTASSFAVIGTATVTNGGGTRLEGGTDIATGDTSITGEETITRTAVGKTYVSGDAESVKARNDLATAQQDAWNLPAVPIAPTLAGLVVAPGVYESPSAISMTTDMTFDGGGDSNSVFVIRTTAAMNITAGTKVHLINEAQACNIYWVTGGAVTLAATSSFAGRVMASAAVTIGAGTSVNGQVMSSGAEVTLSANTITNGCGTSLVPVPPTLDVTGGAAQTTNNSAPTISGTSDAFGRDVAVTVGAQTFTATVLGDGKWSVTAVELSDGDHTVTATVINIAGTSATKTQTLTVDTTPPSLDFTGGAVSATAEANPPIAGTSDAIGRTVTVTVAGVGVPVITVTATVVSPGVWTVSPGVVSNGVKTVTATVSDAAGNITTATQTLTVDTTAPKLTVDGGPVVLTSDATPTVSGTSDLIGGTVTIVVGGTAFTAVVDVDGNWSVESDTLTDGEHTVEVTVVDPAGNRNALTQTLTVDATEPTISVDGGAERSTADPTPVVSGRSSVIGGTVTVTIGDETITATVDSLGVWLVESPAFTTGVHTVTVSVTDSRSRSVTARQALNYLFASAAVIINTTGAQTIRQGMRDMIDVTGDGFAAGESVEIWLHSTPVMLGTATADADGHITIRLRDAATTPAGVHHVVLVGGDSGTSGDSLRITVLTSTGGLALTGVEPQGTLLVGVLLLLLSVVALTVDARRRRRNSN